MPTANHLINALAAQDAEGANTAFEAAIQDKLTDYLEVRKVEIASTIMDDLQEGKKLRASEKTHQVVYTVPGEGKQHQYFHVHADDEDHAREQLMDAEPKAKIHKVEKLREGVLTKKYDTLAKPYIPSTKSVDKMQSIQTRIALKAKKLGIPENELWKKMRDNTFRKTNEETLEETPTRKHFQQVADLIKEIPDEAKRKELAQHHAGIFKGQNPRFDHKRFYQAANVKIDEALDPGSKTATASTAQINRNVLQNIRRATQTLRVAGVNPTMAAAAHRDFGKLAAKSPKAPGYLLMRKLGAQKAQAIQGLTQAGVPLGQSLEANPNEFNQALQRIKRFK